MTRDELIEAMARAMCARTCEGCGTWDSHTIRCGDDWRECADDADAALSALEAIACVVPRKATGKMIDAAQRAWTPGVSHGEAHQIRFAAMLEASPFRSKP